MVGNVQYAEFRLDEIFDISRGVRVTKANQEPGDIPYVTAFTSNNGIDSYIDNPPFIQNTILTASFLGDVFYHPYDVSYKDGTYGLKFKEGIAESDRLYLYFAPMIEKIAKSTASYSQNMILKDYESMILQLPTTPSDQPDFDFMENYIKEIEQKHIKKLESDLATRTENLLTVIGREDLVGDPDGLAAVVGKGFDDSGVEYAEFRVGDLFDINPTKAYTTLKDEEIMVGDETPFITTTVSNNGIRGYSDLEPLNKGNSLTASDTTTSDAIFYQADDYIGRSHVQGLHPKFKGFNKAVAMYILTAFRKSADGLYDYGTKFNRVKMRATTIELPITATGTPDFEFMEQYIAHIELKYTHTDAMVESERIAITKELVE